MTALPAFLAVAVLIVVTPGPDMALVTRNALRGGRRAALLTALGVETGLVAWTAASVLALAALLAASATAFAVLKVAGALYLVYLGLLTLLSLRQPVAETPTTVGSAVGSPFREGLLSNLLNPKIAVFFTSLIPQFVAPGPAAVLESALFGALFVGLGLLWLTAYALIASAGGQLLRRPPVKRLLDAVTGTILVGFGVRLATASR